ncbi:MAG TPA: hypothetical protein VGC97_18030 [Pyrinomonadaceae bacterium]|jgi:hypothetical protein
MASLNQKIRRLPGFRFEAVAPAREDVLPRMDVALFVGFASTGPIGIAVAVESAEQFKTIFGNDLTLVWDAEKSETVYAYLAPAVRSFFRNGGRRCWILRVARTIASEKKPLNRACYNFFPLSGFARVRFDGNEIATISPAFARARTRGSWSDDLQIGTAVLSQSIGLADFQTTDDEKHVVLEIDAHETVSTGDLLRLTFGTDKPVLLLAVDRIKEPKEIESPPKKMPEVGKRIVEFASRRFVWLTGLPETFLSPPLTSPAEFIEIKVRIWNAQGAEDTPLDSEHSAQFKFLESEDAPRKVSLKISDLTALPAAGSFLTAEFDEALAGFLVEDVITSDDLAAVEIICRAIVCQRDIEQTATAVQSERLTFEFWIKKDESSLTKLSDVAFNAENERFWGDLPTDDDFYHFSESAVDKNPSWKQVAGAVNFPLAGIGGDRADFYFPLFAFSLPENYLGAVPLQGTKLQRDGLEEFNEDLFLDEDLKNTGLGSLLNEAEFIRYLSSRPRSLRGIHAALVPETAAKIAVESEPSAPAFSNYSLDECTIIAVPDAVHRGWSHITDEGGILSPPVFSPPLRPQWWHFQDCWSPDIKRVNRPPAGKFLDCGLRFVEAPENLKVKEKSFSSGKFTLEWTSDETGEDLQFVLEESTSPKFEFPVEIFRAAGKHFEITPPRRAGLYFYRVRVEIGKNFSDWSIGLAVKIPEAENWLANAPKDYKSDVLLAVQRALLRMSAARGDLFAVLDMPEHFDELEVFAHVGTLKATKGLTPATNGIEPFSADETRSLSYGAIYHPWLLTHEEDFESFRNIPPDGAMVGVMAKRSFERGAWIAPANEALKGILGLAKDIKRARFPDFQDNLINLVRQEPRGFLVLDSDTLCDDLDWRSINVRRLIGLLRRLAVKHGAEYVFEPNDERFRRQVERGFSELLDLMFVRGAFAGNTPANSYQVVIGETVNNFQSIEQGRFIVELRVAPSLPLKFVTVRLIQAGGRSNVVEVF